MVRNRIKYFLVLGVEVFLCLFYHNITFRLLLIVSILIPCVSCIQLFFIFQYTDVSIEFNKSMIRKNKRCMITLCVTNTSFLPISGYNVNVEINNAFYNEKEKYCFSIPVVMNDSRSVTFEISSSLCGNIVAKVDKIEVFDMLHLKNRKISLDIKDDIMILPNVMKEKINIEHIQNVIVNEDKADKRNEDIYEISNIREYINGDRLQKIHWKLSSKQDELMVKQNDYVFDSKLDIVIELSDSSCMFNNDMIDNDGFERKIGLNSLDNVIEDYFMLAHQLVLKDEKLTASWFDYENGIYRKFDIDNDDDIIISLKEIYNTKISGKKLNSYIAYCNQKDNDECKALYITNKVSLDGVVGEVIENLNNDTVIMCI